MRSPMRSLLLSCCSLALLQRASPAETAGVAPVLQRAPSACFATPSLSLNRLLVSGQRRATSDARARHGPLMMGQMGKGGKVGWGADATDLGDALSMLQADGLKVAPAKPKAWLAAKTKGKGGKAAVGPPSIVWGDSTRKLLWPEAAAEKLGWAERVPNDQGFPLFLIEGLLAEEDLSDAVDLADSLWRGEQAQAIEQFGRGETVSFDLAAKARRQVIRRSQVARLPPTFLPTSPEQKRLQRLLFEALPEELSLGGAPHPYEDGSVVAYSAGDFYAEHHDSWNPGDAWRRRPRAFTALVYLAPAPAGAGGGTEFTRLTRGGKPLVMQPREGDALVWPNFSPDGKWCEDSLHRAVPVKGATARKVVANLWWEAQAKGGKKGEA